MATKIEGGGGSKALVARPIKKISFFCGFPNHVEVRLRNSFFAREGKKISHDPNVFAVTRVVDTDPDVLIGSGFSLNHGSYIRRTLRT